MSKLKALGYRLGLKSKLVKRNRLSQKKLKSSIGWIPVKKVR